MRSCFRKAVLPLPLLGGRGSKAQSLRELNLEDLSFREGQAATLAKALPNFGMNAFKKIRLVNNNLNDEDLALIVEGAAKNGSVEAVEFQYNQLDKKGVEAMCQLLGSTTVRSVFLNHTSTPRKELFELIEKLNTT